MRWWPVYRRELGASLQSPAVLIFAALFFALLGVLFARTMLLFTAATQGDAQALRALENVPLNVNDYLAHQFFGITLLLLILSLPMLTMRLIAEERKIGTFDLLMSYPLREIDVVAGKFAAAWSLVGLLLLLSLLFPVLMAWSSGGQMEIAPIVAGYIGLLCAGAAFVAIGLFASCLTENQLVAGLLTLGILLLGVLLGNLASEDSGALASVLRSLDILEHCDPFLRGLVRLSGVTHFAAMTIGALYLADKALTFRRLGVIR
ncbi:ABC transporter permease subunit [Candidatus Sumerlaeota bacterium]|nr:ABC transporter permease subunit [Candidatus Sumerlaeota bacterium]